ncbi:hypothetical protein ABT294_21450 [Nonomuraea sp. NPDC000554]|uniref:hypothetical protein n=1 Tax=Nonomuraea sp. NPDC000554 TaxID=3154259 RepID=UPI003333102A
MHGHRASPSPEVDVFQLSLALLSLLSALWPAAEPPVPDRWHAWPTIRIFPRTVPGTSPSGARVTYVLAGIAPETSCRAAFQRRALPALPGCLTALRATYADSTQTYVATVGIAVLAKPGRRTSAHWGGRPPTVRPVAFSGGPAERFGPQQYFTGGRTAARDRYVVLTAAGYADGRAYRPGDRAPARLRATARQLATALYRNLTR